MTNRAEIDWDGRHTRRELDPGVLVGRHTVEAEPGQHFLIDDADGFTCATISLDGGRERISCSSIGAR